MDLYCNSKSFHKTIVVFFLLALCMNLDSIASVYEVFTDKTSSQSVFAAAEIAKALQSKGDQGEIISLTDFQLNKTTNPSIVLVTLDNKLMMGKMRKSGLSPDLAMTKEGFCIRRGKKSEIWVVGKDAAGLMYGGFELAEIVSTSGIESVANTTQSPYMAMRGVKFNIPLDVRTPTYTDASDAAQKNMSEMWNFDFWKEYIDSLAKFRYNYVSLWSLHPFPSLVRVPEYSDVALNDVHRSTTDWKENYNLNGWGLDAPEIVSNYEVIKKMTIDEKMEFWRKVMRYGKERNVDFYVVTWNIFTNGTFGKYGITDKLENPVTRDYFRKSVGQMFLTYPDLAGIGLTTGENMYQYSTQQKEDWAFDTYGQGVLDVLKEQPNRKITFIHRQHQTGALEIARRFAPLVDHPNVNFIFSFKYAQAHVYSSTKQPFHQGFVDEIQKEKKLKTIWTLRNDDVFHFRWGAPDFVREFIKNIPHNVSEGYYYGSDQYVWGREFLSTTPENPRQIEIAKHWFQWMLWGRLGYNPEIDNDRFSRMISARFPGTDGAKLLETWQNASMIYPLVTGFHWGALDFQWYIESGQSRPDPAQTPSGYHDVNRFISLTPHKGTDNVSIPDYVKAVASKTQIAGTSPIELASRIIDCTDNALSGAEQVHAEGNNELLATLEDIRSMAYLGKYYAHKIIAATELALFREMLNPKNRENAFAQLNQSAVYWRYYSSLSLSNYHNPLWTNRVGHVDWKKTYGYVLYDITSNGGKLSIPAMEPTPGGTILEAEEAKSSTSKPKSTLPGFTGAGYLEYNAGDALQSVEWIFDAPEEGIYTLEFRYGMKRQEDFVSPVLVNGKPSGEITFWMNGASGSWVWDRVSVSLKKGTNTIHVSPEGFVLFDHLNIIKE